MQVVGQILVGEARPRRRRAALELARAVGLEERLRERPPDAHRLAHRLHLRAERLVGAGELLEGEARELDDDVVERGLEARRRRLRQVVRDLVERVADGELGRDLGDRVARRLGGERRGARDARVHLDDAQLAGLAAARELDVRAARLDADGADDRRGRVAELLVRLVGERHLRRDRDRVARVHAHRVEVLDRADDHDVVRAVAHDLELELVPAAHGLLDEHLPDRRLPEPALDLVRERGAILGEPTSVAAEREGGPHHGGGLEVVELVEARDDGRGRNLEAARLHRLAKQLAVLRAPDHVDGRADQLDAEFVEHAVLLERDGEVERGLPAERRQERVGPLAPQHRGDALEVERLDVGAVGEPGVGHDRRRVRVDDDRAEALLAQHLERLAARVVELARLPDDDRAGADDADRLDVRAPRHLATKLLDEALENRPRVVRAWPGLGVELHGARAQLGEVEALDGAVVQRDVRRLRALGRLDREAVVLARDEHAARLALEHRMVRAAVAERQLVRRRGRSRARAAGGRGRCRGSARGRARRGRPRPRREAARDRPGRSRGRRRRRPRARPRDVVCGTTVTAAPACASRRMIERLAP